MPKAHRSDEMTALAPDGAEIRNLIHHAEGATRLSLAEALIPVGHHTAKVYHQTVYEEIWYVVQGQGTMHLHAPGAEGEEVFPIELGDAVLILPGHGFWAENTGEVDLIVLCCGSPPATTRRSHGPPPGDGRVCGRQLRPSHGREPPS